MMYVEVAAGLVILLIGGDLLVRGAVSVAERFGVPPLLIGLTVVAFGTSAPELVTSIDAVLAGAPTIALGNVVGSNIANVFMVLGVAALIFPIANDPGGVRRDCALMMVGTLVFVAFAWTGTFDAPRGAVLVAVLVAFLGYTYVRATREGAGDGAATGDELEGLETRPHSTWLAILFIAGGLAGLVLGAGWLIDGAVAIARAWHVSEAVIGLTVIAIGTSLPELATSLVAAFRRHGDLAIGNVLGSNMFNILGILGVAAMVGEVPVPAKMLAFDIWVMVGATVLLTVLGLARISIGRIVGAGFVIAYGVYIAVQFGGAGLHPAMG